VISSCGERYYYSICAPEEAFAEPGDDASEVSE